MMCVKLTLAPVVRANWLFRMRRLTSRSRAGTVRTLVAVGTAKLASMLATMRDAAPRGGVASPLPRPAATGAAAAGATGTGAARPGVDAPETAGTGAAGAATWL